MICVPLPLTRLRVPIGLPTPGERGEPHHIRIGGRRSAGVKPASTTDGVNLEAIERDLVNKALARARNNKSQAAKLLGVPRGQFYSLLRRFGLTDARR